MVGPTTIPESLSQEITYSFIEDVTLSSYSKTHISSSSKPSNSHLLLFKAIHPTSEIISHTISYMNMWSQLSNEILVTILLKSSLLDRVRAGAVCVSWQSALNEMKALKLHPPYLLLLSKDLETDIHRFLDISNNTIDGGLHIPETHQVSYLGSFNEWLILSKWFTGELFILNPYSKEQIKLPCPAQIFNFKDNSICVVEDFGQCHHLHSSTAILSSAPTSDNCVVLIVEANSNLLSFCRRGDVRWTVLKGVPFYDITWYEGRVYFIRRRKDFTIWKLLEYTDFKWWNDLPPNVVEIEEDCNAYEAYFVESCSELLIVLRLRPNYDDDESSRKEFCVFKMDESGRFSIKVESLGDRMLFVGKRCSKSFSATELFGFEENCIYYEDDHAGKLRVFHVEDGSIKTCFPTRYFSHSCFCSFIWLMS